MADKHHICKDTLSTVKEFNLETREISINADGGNRKVDKKEKVCKDRLITPGIYHVGDEDKIKNLINLGREIKTKADIALMLLEKDSLEREKYQNIKNSAEEVVAMLERGLEEF